MTVRNAAIVSEARAWIATPYVHQQATKGAGCDCLGLVRGVWRVVMGAEPERGGWQRDARASRGA